MGRPRSTLWNATAFKLAGNELLGVGLNIELRMFRLKTFFAKSILQSLTYHRIPGFSQYSTEESRFYLIAILK